MNFGQCIMIFFSRSDSSGGDINNDEKKYATCYEHFSDCLDIYSSSLMQVFQFPISWTLERLFSENKMKW